MEHLQLQFIETQRLTDVQRPLYQITSKADDKLAQHELKYYQCLSQKFPYSI